MFVTPVLLSFPSGIETDIWRTLRRAVSQDAWRRGFTCGRVHGIVREQSPTTLRDFLKQRRRWFMGIRDIQGMYGLPRLAINLWITGVFTLAVTIVRPSPLSLSIF